MKYYNPQAERWLLELRSNAGAENLKKLRDAYIRYQSWCRENSVELIYADSNDIDNYASHLKTTSSPSQITHGVSMLRKFYSYFYSSVGRGFQNPMLGWKLDTSGLPTGKKGAYRPEKANAVHVFSVEQINDYFKNAYDLLDQRGEYTNAPYT
jgi:hypothetical protein